MSNGPDSFNFGANVTSNNSISKRDYIERIDGIANTDATMFRMAANSLNRLIGLESVKQEVEVIISTTRVQVLREKFGLGIPEGLPNYVLSGNPGTCKTTVAGIIGQVYKSLGLLSKGHFVRATKSDLVAEYIGQTAPKTTNFVNKAIGGVLFIDEAYAIGAAEPGKAKPDSFCQECLATLGCLMEANRHDLVVMAAGYPHHMKQFLAINPGLASRFDTKLNFPDYTIHELAKIFASFMREGNYEIRPEVLGGAVILITAMKERMAEDFGNAREVRNLYESTLRRQATRVIREGGIQTKDRLMEIKIEDLPSETIFGLGPESFGKFVKVSKWVGEYGDELSYANLTLEEELPELTCTTREILLEQLRHTDSGI